MDAKQPQFASIDEYIATFPQDTQKKLQAIRAVIRAAAPQATEKISYQMPTFFLEGNLVHFAAFKNHIGFYPTPGGILDFKDELAQYASAKGSVRLPNDQPLPLELIGKIVKARVAENVRKAGEKARKK